MRTCNHRVVVSRHGGPEALVVIEEDLPEPTASQARVRVAAAGVSAYDLMFRRSGRLPGTPRVPFTPGVDVVGVVDAVGHDVRDLQVGQSVAGWTIRDGGMGGYAEHACLEAEDLVPVPDGVDAAEAVCMVVNFLTAHGMMHRVAQVEPGERALVQGAAGGVGSALVQLGALAGLEVYGTASTGNLAVVADLGATPVDYRTEDVVARVRELTGDGVDVVFDPIGGARQLWRSYRTLRRGGRLVWFGMAATREHGLRVIPGTLAMRALLAALPDGKTAPSAPDLSTTGDDWYRRTLTELLENLATGTIKPLVAARIPLEHASQAHAMLERGGHAGKIVLVTSV
jgi:NADPH:quinone reductase-like Zn-dependent oxidoreductase